MVMHTHRHIGTHTFSHTTLNPISRDLTSFANAFMVLIEVFHMLGSN